MNPGYRKRTIILLVALLVVRFWFGQTFQLTGREAYLWLEGHGVNLSAGYWERGPLTPLLVRIGTSFFGDTELGVRWLAAMIACGTGFTLFYLARHWFNARTAFWTVVLFVVVPMYAWKLSFLTEATAAIGLMAVALFALSRAIEEDKARWWLLGGVTCGLGMLVSIADAWWIAGLLLYLAIDPARRPRLREPSLWSMLILAVIFLAPLVWWWHGSQVADIRRTRLVGDWPLSHPFSLTHGIYFIGLELIYLCPVFVLALAVVLARTGRDLWRDPRYSLLVCLALPGLAWENFAAFFGEGNFDLATALFLPLLLLAGCCADRLSANERRRVWIWGAVLALAAIQSLAGVLSFHSPRGEGRTWARLVSGESVGGFQAGSGTKYTSWRALADQMVQMQREAGANLVITDSPLTASALSFYMPRHPSIYVLAQPGVVTQFDFWQPYTEAASPNDSALYLTRSTDPQPPAELAKNFSSVTQMPDMPDPEDAKTWNLWSCQTFVGQPQPAGAEATPMHETDSLPK
jgi:4-amino-4-deoxy-L-arabinose transferase-like glycosyltransferase